MVNRNVFLFGAGVSFDAGVPLLGNFVDCMLDMHFRGACKGKKLKTSDREILEAAFKAREELDSYHGRAAFDDRNIEDILSILSLAANAGVRGDRARFNAFVRAIATTIDLRCEISEASLTEPNQSASSTVYGDFWRSIIASARMGGGAPIIISLNYDLVLERSLFATVAGSGWGRRSSPFPFESIRLRYHCDTLEEKCFAVQEQRFADDDYAAYYDGYVLKPIFQSFGKTLTIEILKLHGSLNFPRKKGGAAEDIQWVHENPLIMPPVFVKSGERALEGVWSRAMEALRSAIHLVVCGYSLPVTDTYMQYFLKAALGPNRDLGRVLVFDPALSRDDEGARAMKARYSGVFSQQIRSRIYFDPLDGRPGTFRGFVGALQEQPGSVLF